LLTGKEKPGSRDKVFLERERHANVRKGDLSYPVRAMRTAKFLYVWNLRPDLWPAGDPEMYKAVGAFGDIDNSPSKDVVLEQRDDAYISRFFKLAAAKRPAEELYDLAKDAAQLTNVANRSEYAATKKKYYALLLQWMKATGDPRAKGDDDRWDRYPYFGSAEKMPTSK
jgi:hypothetical protein